jgi:serine/threonine-protein kinase RsbW
MAATFHQSIESDFQALKGLMEAAEEFLQGQGVDAQAIFRINLTLEEIVTNIIKFGNNEAEHKIDVAVNVGAEAVEAVIIDEGYEFNPVLHQRQQPSEILTERATGGLGIYLIKKLLDNMNYRREGHRNIIEVKANRKKANPPPA